MENIDGIARGDSDPSTAKDPGVQILSDAVMQIVEVTHTPRVQSLAEIERSIRFAEELANGAEDSDQSDGD